MLKHALWYASRGFSVLPLHTFKNGKCTCGNPLCNSPAKHPRTLNGVKDATTNSDIIKKWWSDYPDSNIGIATGTISGIVVLDIDVDIDRDIDGNDSLKLWESEQSPLPHTWQCLTGGGGIHYYFSIPKTLHSVVKNRTKIMPGIDCRGDGGYIVAPPSLHVSGRHYEWEVSSNPDNTELTSLPDDLRALLTNNDTATVSSTPFEVPANIISGNRNDVLFKLASSLRAKGLSEDSVLSVVSIENVKKCSPPLQDKEVVTICKSAMKYDSFTDIQQDIISLDTIDNAVTAYNSIADLTSLDVMKSIFNIKDVFQRQQKVNGLRESAAKIKQTRAFDAALNAFKRQFMCKSSKSTTNPINVTDCPIVGLRSAKWTVTDGGISRISSNSKGEDFEEVAANQPIVITERLRNIDDNTQKVKIAFLDKRLSKWHYLTIPKLSIADKRKVVELADNGVNVTSETSKLLVDYFNDLESSSIDIIPIAESIGRLGWMDNFTKFSPYVDDIRFDGNACYENMFNAVHTCGDFEKWKSFINTQKLDSFEFRTMLNASFASPLVGLLKKPTFFVHLWGNTGNGKTVAAMAAMSVWGDPSPGKLVLSFNATNIGLEMLAGFYCNLPLALNELQTVKNSMNNQQFDNLIYQLCEGQGRTRSTKNGGTRRLERWQLSILSTGEEPITTDHSGGGAKNRVVEIYSVDNIFKSAPTVADFVQENFGHAGKVFVDGLISSKKEDIEKYFNFFYDLLIKDYHTTDKQAISAAILCVADYLSSIWVFNMSADESMENALSFAETMFKCLPDVNKIDVVEAARDYVIGWIAGNQAHFLGASDTPLNSSLECYGKMGNSENIYIISSKLSEVLDNAGYSSRRILKGFSERGYIDVFTENSYLDEFEKFEKTPAIATKRFSKPIKLANILTRCTSFKKLASWDDISSDM